MEDAKSALYASQDNFSKLMDQASHLMGDLSDGLNPTELNDLARTRRLQRTCSYGGRAFAAVAVPHNEIKVVVRQQVRDVRLAHRSETDPTDRRLVVGRHCLQTVSNTYTAVRC